MLYIGEKVGSQEDGAMEVDIAVDPLDGTELIAKGLPNAIAVIAMGEKRFSIKCTRYIYEKK